MSHVLMALVIFLIVVIVHLLYCNYQKKSRLYPKIFLILSLFGLNLLWLLFAFFPFDPLGPDLKSTSTFIYLFLIPLFLSFYRAIDLPNPFKKIFQILKEHPNTNYEELLSGVKEEKFVEQCLSELVQDGYIYQKEDKYYLTSQGSCVASLLKIFRFLSGKTLGA